MHAGKFGIILKANLSLSSLNLASFGSIYLIPIKESESFSFTIPEQQFHNSFFLLTTFLGMLVKFIEADFMCINKPA